MLSYQHLFRFFCISRASRGIKSSMRSFPNNSICHLLALQLPSPHPHSIFYLLEWRVPAFLSDSWQDPTERAPGHGSFTTNWKVPRRRHPAEPSSTRSPYSPVVGVSCVSEVIPRFLLALHSTPVLTTSDKLCIMAEPPQVDALALYESFPRVAAAAAVAASFSREKGEL